MNNLPQESVLVVGFARTGQAVAKTLVDRARSVTAIDDVEHPGFVDEARRIGVSLEVAPDHDRLRSLVDASGLVVLSPGIPPSHAVFSVADRSKIVSEVELAFALTSVPIVAITGTNGKTTVTSLVASMLGHSGFRVRAVGNIGDPLINVVDCDIDFAVAEVSSFQLMFTKRFRPIVGTWLNFAPDHLDWHRDMSEYASAKTRIWKQQVESDVAVANADDPVVWSIAEQISSRLVSFGLVGGDYHFANDQLVGPTGEVLALRGDLRRSFPHDISNALAALATARSAGASVDGCREALRESVDLPHRVAIVSSLGGVDFFDDSKATTPSAVVAALQCFSSVVLIAGGHNKGLDLGEIREFVDSQKGTILRAVVAIGEASDEVAKAFEPRFVVERASSMNEAVATAWRIAREGDAVLLSPGCASFDWYTSYEERGDDFARCVRVLKKDQARSAK